MEFVKKYWKIGLLLSFIGFVLIPFLVLIGEHFLNFGWFSEADNGDWLGFWGGYLGALIAIPGAYYVAVYSSTKSEKQNEKDKLDKLALPIMKYEVEIRQFTRFDFQQLKTNPNVLQSYKEMLASIINEKDVEYSMQVNLATIALDENISEMFRSVGDKKIKAIDSIVSSIAYDLERELHRRNGIDNWIIIFEDASKNLKEVAKQLDFLVNLSITLKENL